MSCAYIYIYIYIYIKSINTTVRSVTIICASYRKIPMCGGDVIDRTNNGHVA